MTDDYLRAFSGAVKHDSPNHYPSLKYRSGHHKPSSLQLRMEALMLTWAIAWFSVKSKGYNGLWFIASIIGDCTMTYYISCAIAGKQL